MALSGDEAARYARHIVLKDMGGAGQQKLKNARVLIVGAGGLGAPVIAYLAAAGIGTLGVVDPDKVSLSNLQRQIIHGDDTIGSAKTKSAQDFVARINPFVRYLNHQIELDATNAGSIIANYDLVVEGTDDFASKQTVSQACEAAKIPLVTGALGPFDGTLTVLMPYARNALGRDNPRFSDLYPVAPDPKDSPPCEIAGVLNVLPGIIGTMMANEALKLIAGYGAPLVGKLLVYSARTGESHILDYRREGENPSASSKAASKASSDQ